MVRRRFASLRVLIRLSAAIACVAVIHGAAPTNWPQFRGLTGGVIPDDPQLPEHWSRTENVAWKVDVGGQGWGSPIVWDDYVFVTSVITPDKNQGPAATPGLFVGKFENKETAEGAGPDPDFAYERRWVLYAFDFKTGKLRWETELHRGLPIERKYRANTYASETPVTDGRNVYVFHVATGRMIAVDFRGHIVWSHELRLPDARSLAASAKDESSASATPSSPPPQGILDFGSGASPIYYNGRLYVTMDYQATQWMLVALDAETGKELWHVHRPKKTNAWGWSTPYIWKNAGRTEIVAAGNLGARSFDFDGKQLWEFTPSSVNVAPTPFAADGLLYLSSGFPGDRTRPLVAIRPGASGDISLKEGDANNQFVAWYHGTGGSYATSAIVYRGYYYSFLTQGYVSCYDAKTGEQVYGRTRIDDESTGFTASPWEYNGKIFALSEEGNTFVIQPGSAFKVLYKNTLDEVTLATPAIVRNSIVLRTASHLFRIAAKR
jgi:outer membrane protein assembly factor BamB